MSSLPKIDPKNFQKAVKENYAYLKNTDNFADLFVKSIYLPENKGTLLPIANLHKADKSCIQNLAKWREENSFAFPSKFKITFEGTAKWLDNLLLQVENKILFLVLNSVGYPIGHLGFANGLEENFALEIDNVVRGDKDKTFDGIMSVALSSLIKWGLEVVGAQNL